MTAPDPETLRLLAIEIARDAAAFVAEARQIGTDVIMAGTDTKSTPTDMVTAVDKASEERIVAAIQARRPDDGLLGEEGNDYAGSTGLQWVIDPIDGTTNFVYNYPASAVSIGVVDIESRESIAAAVVHTGGRQVFSAARGGGAFVDGSRLVLATGPETLAHALVGTGFSYSPATRVLQAEVISRILPIIRDIRRSGSAALDLCWSAAGWLDAYFETGTKEWDRAAGSLLCTEVGLRYVAIDGEGDEPDFVFVAHPRIADELYDLVKP